MASRHTPDISAEAPLALVNARKQLDKAYMPFFAQCPGYRAYRDEGMFDLATLRDLWLTSS